MRPYDMFIKLYGKLPTERDSRYLELVRMTKYRITNVVDTQPGRCANCGASRTDGRSYIDCGVEVEFYGTVIFCSICVGDMARNLGLFRASELKILQLEQKIAELKGRTDLTEELKSTVLLTYNQIKEIFNGSDIKSDSSEPSIVGVTGLESVDANFTEADRKVISPKSGSTKPVTKPRSTDVPSLADIISNQQK